MAIAMYVDDGYVIDHHSIDADKELQLPNAPHSGIHFEIEASQVLPGGQFPKSYFKHAWTLQPLSEGGYSIPD